MRAYLVGFGVTALFVGNIGGCVTTRDWPSAAGEGGGGASGGQGGNPGGQNGSAGSLADAGATATMAGSAGLGTGGTEATTGESGEPPVGGSAGSGGAPGHSGEASEGGHDSAEGGGPAGGSDGAASCGDGNVDAPEECDDGNAESGDGCDTACAVEDSWNCSGQASTCNRSCSGLNATCGPNGSNCCAVSEVPGGTFNRGNDAQYPATVSSFRLDNYEITVGRFRKFVAAWASGWRPYSGSGKHKHLNGGNGIALPGGGYELGWNSDWLSSSSPSFAAIPSTPTDWDSALAGGTWTSSPGANENVPVTLTSWYENYAFCIWDGGFLPTEAEWNYAASGGDQQRPYPWGQTTPGSDTSLAIHDCHYGTGSCEPTTSVAPVGSAGAGAGRYGQQDLAGNVWEWVLDWHKDYVVPCADCAELVSAEARVYRGGSFYNGAQELLTSYREHYPPRYRSVRVGARCARVP